MLLTPFPFIWVLQMFIGYSTFLINIYFGSLVFQLGIFVNVKNVLTKCYSLCLIAAMNINMLLTTDFILNQPVGCAHLATELKLNCGRQSDKIWYP